jgi:hypothetical protein
MRRTIPGLLILAAATTLSPAVRAESVLRVAMTLAAARRDRRQQAAVGRARADQGAAGRLSGASAARARGAAATAEQPRGAGSAVEGPGPTPRRGCGLRQRIGWRLIATAASLGFRCATAMRLTKPAAIAPGPGYG